MDPHHFMGERKIVLWVPDWSIAALSASVPPLTPAATVRAGTIVATTRTARIYGVRRGMRQSTAQQLCSDLVLLPHDPVRDDSAFEGILQIFDQMVAGVCGLRPGLAWAALSEKSRWGDQEEEVVAALAEHIAGQAGVEAYVGVGTGFAAAMAAARRGICVPLEETEAFLGTLQVEDLLEFLPEEDRQEYDPTLRLLGMLGIRSVEQLRGLGQRHLLTRFGRIGQKLWTLSMGGDLFVKQQGSVIPDLTARIDFDPSVTEIDHALVGARRVAQDLVDQMERGGLYAQSVVVVLHGEDTIVSHRKWALFNTTSSAQVAMRIMWQMRGWQERTERTEVEADGRLRAIEVIAVDLLSHFATGALWGSAPRSEKVDQTVARVQTMVGEDAVVQPKIQGGPDPRNRVLFRPWGSTEEGETLMGEWAGSVREPPSILFDTPPRAKLIGQGEQATWGPIGIGRRGQLQGVPRRLVVLEDRPELPSGGYSLTDFTGLWPVKGIWWSQDPAERVSRCYLRVQREDGADFLLVQREQSWYVEGLYEPLRTAEPHEW